MNVKNLLRKELALGLEIRNYIFLIFAVMMCIPNYPRYVGAFMTCVSVFTMLANSQTYKDVDYCMTLPIAKRDIVKSRCLFCALYEILCILLSVPFALLYNLKFPMPNLAGIESNFACYGIMLILVTVFNFILFTGYYKKMEKPAVHFLFAALAFWALFLIAEAPIWCQNLIDNKYIYMMDSIEPADLVMQLPVLALGIVVFFGGWMLTYKISSKRFEKVDL